MTDDSMEVQGKHIGDDQENAIIQQREEGEEQEEDLRASDDEFAEGGYDEDGYEDGTYEDEDDGTHGDYDGDEMGILDRIIDNLVLLRERRGGGGDQSLLRDSTRL